MCPLLFWQPYWRRHQHKVNLQIIRAAFVVLMVSNVQIIIRVFLILQVHSKLEKLDFASFGIIF